MATEMVSKLCLKRCSTFLLQSNTNKESKLTEESDQKVETQKKKEDDSRIVGCEVCSEKEEVSDSNLQ